MNRRKKITIAIASGVGLIVIGVAVSTVSNLPLASGLSHWPQVPPPELFVTTQPKQADVAGVYQLTQQTISTNGLAILEGHLCQLDLRLDGSFTVTNYPRWSPDSSTTPHVAEFISTTGRWRCDTVGIIYSTHEYWGVVFSDTHVEIDALALRSKGAPYDLMLTYGDGDDGTVMTFGKKK
jgi:hypothetical protein